MVDQPHLPHMKKGSKGVWYNTRTIMALSSQTSSLIYDHAHTSCYPIRWYEKDRIPFVIGLLLAIISWHLQVSLGLFPNFWLSVLGVLLHLLGLAVDIASTHLVFSLKAEFDNRGVMFPLTERNRLLPNYPTLKDQIFSWDLLLNLALAIPIFFIPSGGILALIQRSCAALSNIRKRNRLTVTLTLLDKNLLQKAGRYNAATR
jgi:hypothetical protein